MSEYQNRASLSDPPKCPQCEGAGKLRYHEDNLDANGEVVGHTFGTRACSCVRDLPPITGNATWWDSEVAWQGVWANSIFPDSVVEMTVSAEVPRDENGRRVTMRGNRYYPTMVDVDLPDRLLMHPFMVREFAAKLIEAADAAEAIDKPCEDACGHWWPCGCETFQTALGTDEKEAT